MRSVCCRQFGLPKDLEFIQVDIPTTKSNEALIDVKAAGVGFVDGLMVQGQYQVKPPLPYYPGSEFAGVITEIGNAVTNFKPGDRVMGLVASGAFSDYVVADAAGLIKLPDVLDDLTAAGFYINYSTALYGLRDCGKLQTGETILILGAAGGVGSAVISVAKAMGARVIAAASSDAKRIAASEYGADDVVDYSSKTWRDALKTLTDETGLNVVCDPVGGDVSEPAFRCLSPGGRFLVVGFASGTIPSIALNLPLLKRSSIIGVDFGGEYRANPSTSIELMETLMSWVRNGKLNPAAVASRNMTDAREALTDQLAGKIVGKLVLVNTT
ncbi:MAG: NADPH:quinone oxidoreductase family protein [Deltaproteobacteria bacterium]|nr:NADPH:quinone oxidoreductase family protein [Deltaproteobacteria bacterium]